MSEDVAKDSEASIQDVTNSFTVKIDALIAAKEKDIMKV